MKMDVKEVTNLWGVGNFFQRLWLAIKYKQIYEDLVPALFGDYFIWWYFNCFEPQLKPRGWDSWDYIDVLPTWLKHRVPQDVYDQWKARAEQFRKWRTAEIGSDQQS
jgi:hypothetical protein